VTHAVPLQEVLRPRLNGGAFVPSGEWSDTKVVLRNSRAVGINAPQHKRAM